MGVELLRRADRRMPQHLPDRLSRNAHRVEQRCRRMAQVVEPNRGQASIIADLVERAEKVARFNNGAASSGEKSAGFLPVIAGPPES